MSGGNDTFAKGGINPAKIDLISDITAPNYKNLEELIYISPLYIEGIDQFQLNPLVLLKIVIVRLQVFQSQIIFHKECVHIILQF